MDGKGINTVPRIHEVIEPVPILRKLEDLSPPAAVSGVSPRSKGNAAALPETLLTNIDIVAFA
ncbi:hypothetical protein JH26_07555 [Microvirga sp. BSC39]|nr:hypothetical protein JH26_07555 [Microvirga sp. BSC39]